MKDGAGCIWREGAAGQEEVGPLPQGHSWEACGHSSAGSEVWLHLLHLSLKGEGSSSEGERGAHTLTPLAHLYVCMYHNVSE